MVCGKKVTHRSSGGWYNRRKNSKHLYQRGRKRPTEGMAKKCQAVHPCYKPSDSKALLCPDLPQTHLQKEMLHSNESQIAQLTGMDFPLNDSVCGGSSWLPEPFQSSTSYQSHLSNLSDCSLLHSSPRAPQLHLQHSCQKSSSPSLEGGCKTRPAPSHKHIGEVVITSQDPQV